jgi:hypothetical protein
VGIANMLVIYGVGAVAAGVVFLAVAREHPDTPPGPPEQEERALMLDGLKQIVRKRDFQLLLPIFFIGLGIFNGVTTWIEDIVRPRGFSVTERSDPAERNQGRAGRDFRVTIQHGTLALVGAGEFLESMRQVDAALLERAGREARRDSADGLGAGWGRRARALGRDGSQALQRPRRASRGRHGARP